MIGDSECDINFEGINVMTYHTALSAYNEKYIVAKGSGKIVIDKFAGETIKKPTTQLESEYNQEQINYDRKYKILESSGLDEKQITQSIKKEHLSLQKSKNILNNRYASITKKDKIRKLIESCVGVLFDETHIAAIILEAIGNHAKNAYYKYGMSATAYRTDNQEIRLEGTMGRKFIDISVSDLIELQYLVPPHIYIIKMSNLIPVEYDEDGIKVKYTYQEIYNLGIIHNYKRNYTIKKISESLKENNIPTIIIIDQLEHGKILEEMIKDSVFVPGSAKKNVDDDDYEPTNEEISYRRQMLDKCERNEIILIATKWANTGINAPLIQGLVLGGSSTSPITTMQTIGRVLRKVDNKEFAIVIDFMDKDKYFHEHALQRRRIYKLEQYFFVHNI